LPLPEFVVELLQGRFGGIVLLFVYFATTKVIMDNLPVYIALTFTLTTILTIIFFYIAANKSTSVIIILFAWIILQTILGMQKFYTVTNTMPPRLLFLALPAVIFIGVLFISRKGKQFIHGLDIKYLTLLHCVRIPVEIVLFWLFVNKAIPQLMTFEGRNFDIAAGLTAPVIYYFAFVKKYLGKAALLTWNFICLALLLNIVVNAVLSAPTAFQQFAFDQPNIAILYFPFTLLPAVVVPLVLLSHLATITQLLKKED